MTPKANPAARWRLVCLPHAGGGASAYHAWGAALQPAGIEVRAVQLPGRETRFAEPRIEAAETMVAALVAAWPEIAGAGPVAIYGHSMGALLAFELAVELERRNAAPRPARLFVSGHQAPHLPYRAPLVHALPPKEFLPAVSAQFGGIPRELMDEPEIAELIGGTLRSDFTLVETYAWKKAGPLAMPITALGGTQDPWATEAEVAEWARHTRGAFVHRMIPGDHFFNHSAREQVVREIVAALG